jgi:hypothetical protein
MDMKLIYHSGVHFVLDFYDRVIAYEWCELLLTYS